MSTGHAKRTDIEGLRALAVTLVLLYHAQLAWFEGGFLGVDVFFVISGYLITGSLLAEASTSGTVQLRRFYARRARRLLPAAAIVLVATAAGVRFLLPITSWRDLGGDIAAAAAYVVNWRLAFRAVDYLAEDVVASPVQHFWSLAIEEQFYFVWPLLLLGAAVIARRRGWSLRRVAFVVLTLGVVVPSLVWSVVATASLPSRAFFDTGTRMWELAAGGLVAIAPPRAHARRSDVALKVLALLVIVAASVGLDASVPWPSLTALVAVAPTALLLRLGGGTDDLVERALSLRPLQRIGAWSYSIYLWHWPPLAILAARWGGLTVLEAVVITAVSIVPAVLSYRLVENPIRFASPLTRRHGRSLALGAALSVVGLVAGLAVVRSVPTYDPDAEVPTLTLPAAGGDTVTSGDEPSPAPDVPSDPVATPSPTPPPVRSLVGVGAAALLDDVTLDEVLAHLAATREVAPAPSFATQDLPRVYADACHVPVPIDDFRVCRYGDPAGDVHVALVGDSKAGQWGDALEAIGEREGWRLTYLLKSGCELSTALPLLGEEPNTTCDAWNDRALQFLLDDPPDVVLTSQISSVAFAEDGQDGTELLVDGMLDAYAQLRAAGAEVVVLFDNHSPGGRVYECVATAEALADCGFERREGSGGRAAQALAVERGDLPSIDLADRVCPTELCPPVVGGVLLYRQGSHLTKSYIDTLEPYLEERLLPLVAQAA